MKKFPKCEYCNKPINFDNTVIVRIDRYDKFGISFKQKIFCTKCWDNASFTITIDEREDNTND